MFRGPWPCSGRRQEAQNCVLASPESIHQERVVIHFQPCTTNQINKFIKRQVCSKQFLEYLFYFSKSEHFNKDTLNWQRENVSASQSHSAIQFSVQSEIQLTFFVFQRKEIFPTAEQNLDLIRFTRILKQITDREGEEIKAFIFFSSFFLSFQFG